MFQVDPESTAYVRYTPSANNPNAEFADEVYFPTSYDPLETNQEIGHNRIDGPEYEEPITGVVYPNLMKRTWIPAMHRRSPRYSDYISPNNINYYPDEYEEREFDYDNLEKYMPFIEYIGKLKLTPDDLEYLLQPENSGQLQSLLNDFFEVYERGREEKQKQEMLEEWIREENLEFIKEKILSDLARENIGTTKFTRKYNTPDKFRSGWELRDEVPLLDNSDSSDLFESRVYIDENDPENNEAETGSGETIQPQEIFRELKQQQDLQNNAIPEKVEPPLIFTEGGLVYPQFNGEVKNDPEQILKNDLGKFLDEFDWGFKRRERLDVKKPGPPFDEHILGTTEPNIKSSKSRATREKELLPIAIKKDPRGGFHPDPMHELVSYDVDTDYVYIGLKDR